MSALPEAAAAEAIDDFRWFDAHPNRRFRARGSTAGVWIIRRRGDVFLRTLARSLPPSAKDSDAALGPAWFEAAYPGLLAEKAQRHARKAGVRR
jgi:hypothetical protein